MFHEVNSQYVHTHKTGDPYTKRDIYEAADIASVRMGEKMVAEGFSIEQIKWKLGGYEQVANRMVAMFGPGGLEEGTVVRK